jgi:hypothetical protein
VCNDCPSETYIDTLYLDDLNFSIPISTNISVDWNLT